MPIVHTAVSDDTEERERRRQQDGGASEGEADNLLAVRFREDDEVPAGDSDVAAVSQPSLGREIVDADPESRRRLHFAAPRKQPLHDEGVKN